MDNNHFCVNKNFTIREALEFISANKSRAVLVVDDQDRVTGFLSQGDIIRALLSGADLFARIDSYASPSFFYLRSYDLDKAAELAKKKGMTLFPVVDDDFKLMNIITLFDVLEYLGGSHEPQ